MEFLAPPVVLLLVGLKLVYLSSPTFGANRYQDVLAAVAWPLGSDGLAGLLSKVVST